MAYKMTKRGSLDNEVTYEFFCDTVADMNAIENEYRALGSIAIVLTGESGGLEIYITSSLRQWVPLNITTNDSSSSSGSAASLATLPQNNGTYNLQVTIANGQPTYAWAASAAVPANALEIDT